MDQSKLFKYVGCSGLWIGVSDGNEIFLLTNSILEDVDEDMICTIEASEKIIGGVFDGFRSPADESKVTTLNGKIRVTAANIHYIAEK